MKLSHINLRPSHLITALALSHDALVKEGGYLACNETSKTHSVLHACDFVAATVSGANGESYHVFPVRGVMLTRPISGSLQRAWEVHTPKFAVAVFPEEGDADLFEGFASFGDALRFVAGIAPDERSHWPLVIDAEVSYWLARGQMTDVEWPDERV